MRTYRIETTIAKDGRISIQGLPFAKGDKVEVLVRRKKRASTNHKSKYPLRGTPVHYNDPFDSVAENDWVVLE